MPQMRPPRIPRPKETLRRMRIRRDHKAPTLLLAEQENNTRQNSLVLLLSESKHTIEQGLHYGQGTMPTMQSTNALERQTEDFHL